jgi:hypothetical protein
VAAALQEIRHLGADNQDPLGLQGQTRRAERGDQTIAEGHDDEHRDLSDPGPRTVQPADGSRGYVNFTLTSLLTPGSSIVTP